MTGKCANCEAFGSILAESSNQNANIGATGPVKGRNLAQEAQNKKTTAPRKEKSAIFALPELNRVLGGGFMPASVTLLAGEPGVGKSTLALQVAAGFASTLYFSGEESAHQIADRATRLGLAHVPQVFFTTSLGDIYETAKSSNASLLILDSVQTLKGQNALGGTAGAREVAEFALHLAKTYHKTILLIGHVTKGGDIAGPRSLEHLVDVVLELRGDRTTDLRILKSPKNRFGSTQETGVFLFTEKGFENVSSPSDFFLKTQNDAPGTAITTQAEGNRHFFFEIQALSVKTNFGQPRRSTSGFDLSRMQLLLAVVERFTNVSVAEYDLYANVVGGLRINERASDLAFVAAVLSSRKHKTIPRGTLCLGEVGLSGEIRAIPKIESRIKEAARLGFTTILGAKIQKTIKIPKSVTYKTVKNVKELQEMLF